MFSACCYADRHRDLTPIHTQSSMMHGTFKRERLDGGFWGMFRDAGKELGA
jgi:hypothetical protein